MYIAKRITEALTEACRRGEGRQLRIVYLGYEEYTELRLAPLDSGFSVDHEGNKKFRGVKVVVVNEENYLEVH